MWKYVTTVRDPNEQILLSLTKTEGHKIKSIRKAGLSKSKVLSTLYHIWQWANMNVLGKCIIAKKMHSDTSSECRYSLQLFVARGPPKPKVLLDVSHVLCNLSRCILSGFNHPPLNPCIILYPQNTIARSSTLNI